MERVGKTTGQQFVLIDMYSDNSGVQQTYGPFDSQEEAQEAMDLLNEWPVIQASGGKWKVFPLIDLKRPLMPQKKITRDG